MKTVYATCAVIFRNRKIFIAQRNQYGESAFQWEFPGGKIEPNETHEKAIIREIAEELNCEIEIESEIMKIVHRYKTFILNMRVFICRLCKSEPRICEHIDSRWVDIQELNNFNLADADRPIAKHLKNAYCQ